jgi:hypothetical protein
MTVSPEVVTWTITACMLSVLAVMLYYRGNMPPRARMPVVVALWLIAIAQFVRVFTLPPPAHPFSLVRWLEIWGLGLALVTVAYGALAAWWRLDRRLGRVRMLKRYLLALVLVTVALAVAAVLPSPLLFHGHAG